MYMNVFYLHKNIFFIYTFHTMYITFVIFNAHCGLLGATDWPHLGFYITWFLSDSSAFHLCVMYLLYVSYYLFSLRMCLKIVCSVIKRLIPVNQQALVWLHDLVFMRIVIGLKICIIWIHNADFFPILLRIYTELISHLKHLFKKASSRTNERVLKLIIVFKILVKQYYGGLGQSCGSYS